MLEDITVDSNPRGSELQKQSYNQVKLNYFMQTIPFRNAHVPRKGFYGFIEVLDYEFTDRLEMYKVKAYYNSKKPDFSSGFTVPAQISSLFNYGAVGPKEVAHGEILNTIVEVKSVKLETYVYEGKETARYIVEWEILEYVDFNASGGLAAATEPIALEPSDESFSEEGEEEFFDEELELIFWELNQPDYGMDQSEIEFLSDLWEFQNTEIAE